MNIGVFLSAADLGKQYTEAKPASSASCSATAATPWCGAAPSRA